MHLGVMRALPNGLSISESPLTRPPRPPSLVNAYQAFTLSPDPIETGRGESGSLTNVTQV